MALAHEDKIGRLVHATISTQTSDGWEFEDYGPDYTAFRDGRMSGGFAKVGHVLGGGPLVVIYATDLEAVRESVKASGGTITKETFSFPGGRRFHFSDPSGNELAVWSDPEPAA